MATQVVELTHSDFSKLRKARKVDTDTHYRIFPDAVVDGGEGPDDAATDDDPEE